MSLLDEHGYIILDGSLVITNDKTRNTPVKTILKSNKNITKIIFHNWYNIINIDIDNITSVEIFYHNKTIAPFTHCSFPDSVIKLVLTYCIYVRPFTIGILPKNLRQISLPKSFNDMFSLNNIWPESLLIMQICISNNNIKNLPQSLQQLCVINDPYDPYGSYDMPVFIEYPPNLKELIINTCRINIHYLPNTIISLIINHSILDTVTIPDNIIRLSISSNTRFSRLVLSRESQLKELNIMAYNYTIIPTYIKLFRLYIMYNNIAYNNICRSLKYLYIQYLHKCCNLPFNLLYVKIWGSNVSNYNAKKPYKCKILYRNFESGECFKNMII